MAVDVKNTDTDNETTSMGSAGLRRSPRLQPAPAPDAPDDTASAGTASPRRSPRLRPSPAVTPTTASSRRSLRFQPADADVVGGGKDDADPDDDDEEMSATQPAHPGEDDEDMAHPSTLSSSPRPTPKGELRRSPRIANRPVNLRLLMKQWLADEKAEKIKASFPAPFSSATPSVMTRAFDAVSTSGSGEDNSSGSDFEKSLCRSARKPQARNTRKEREKMEELFLVEGEGGSGDDDKDGTWKPSIWCPFAAHTVKMPTSDQRFRLVRVMVILKI